MAGNKAGGMKAAATNKEKYGDNYYANIGAKGGEAKSPTKGFGTDKRSRIDKILGKPKLAVIAGKKGGTISKRGKKQ